MHTATGRYTSPCQPHLSRLSLPCPGNHRLPSGVDADNSRCADPRSGLQPTRMHRTMRTLRCHVNRAMHTAGASLCSSQMIQHPSCHCSPAVGGTTSDGEAIRSHCVMRVHTAMHLRGSGNGRRMHAVVKRPIRPALPDPRSRALPSCFRRDHAGGVDQPELWANRRFAPSPRQLYGSAGAHRSGLRSDSDYGGHGQPTCALRPRCCAVVTNRNSVPQQFTSAAWRGGVAARWPYG